uniref:RE1-silencing transcription factor n=1 Tax=Xiphophorus maculatus TaxID=8083 RepID=A0A3B5QBQ3_XIPMA
MATQTMFSAGMYPVGVSLAEDGPGLSDLPRNTLPAPQLVMLANVAAVTAAEGGDGGSMADEKEMMELKTVGCGYSDSEDEGLIRCERCGYNTNRYDHYIAHLKHHSKEGDDHRVFKCTLCAYTTVSQYHWRKHLRNHFPSKLHTCSQCSYFSDRKSNYIQHIRTHTGVRPFQCLYCDYSSSQKTHLTRHMRTHSACSEKTRPADGEDDEGIHSSHEGGSDISDSASEGSDDSGLNGTGAAPGKLANDPETPTEEIPTPTELKNHTCIFCDRTFPLETQYRRHLNRHLVNVYYMDNAAPR